MSNKYITNYIGSINGKKQDLGNMFYNWTSNTVNISANGTTVKKYSINYNKPTIILDTDIQVSMDGSPNYGDQVYTFGPAVQDRICIMGQGSSGVVFTNNGIEYNELGQYDISSNTGSGFYWDGTKWFGITYMNNRMVNVNSYDGLNWDSTSSSNYSIQTRSLIIERSKSGLRNWTGIDSTPDGTTLVACVNPGEVYKSIDSGITWSTMRGFALKCTAISISDNGSYIAVAVDNGSGSGALYTHYNSSWFAIDTRQYTDVQISNGLLVAIADGNIYKGFLNSVARVQVLTNTDLFVCINLSSEGQYVAACAKYIFISSNFGNNWVQKNPYNTNWKSICVSSSGQYMAACAYNHNIYISTNYGTIWTQSNSSQQNWIKITSSGNGQKLSACVSGGNIWMSSDYGVNWQQISRLNCSAISMTSDGKLNVCESGRYINTITFPQVLPQESSYYNGKIYLLIGNSSYQISYSYDGINWTNITTPIDTIVYSIAWNGFVWLAGGIGETNSLAYSYDGITWLGGAIPLSTVYSICWIENKWIIGGINSSNTGEIKYYLNETWISSNSALFTTSVNSLIWNGQIAIAGGSGSSNALAYSYDGITWIGLGKITPFSTASSGTFVWNGKFFVVSGTGTNTLAYSYDGLTYIGLGSSIMTQPYYSGHNTLRPHSIRFQRKLSIAVGAGTNTIASSPDGITWSGLGTTIFSQEGNAIRYNGIMWIAGGTGTNNSLAFSYDGYTWYGLSKTVFTQTFGLEWNGTMWIAGGKGTNTLAYSYDGVTWFGLGKTIFTVQCNKIATNGKMWVAMGQGGNTIAYSYNGITWTGIGISIFSTVGNGVSWNGQMWVAMGIGTNKTAYSYDGITWYPTPNTMTSGISVSNNNTIWSSMGTGRTTASYSYDGITWTGVTTVPFSTIGNAITWNGTLFEAVGKGTTNNLAYSHDGIIWTGVTGTTIFSSNGNDVYSNNQIKPKPYIQHPTIAFGSGGNTIAYSPDGILWTPLGNNIFSISGRRAFWNGKLWVACGEGGNTLAYSYDGMKWTGLGSSIFTTSGYSVTYNGNVWIAVGQGENTIAYSPNGIQWKPVVNSSNIFTTKCINISWNGTTFLACGQGSNSFATSQDGVNWSGVSVTDYNSVGVNNVSTNGNIIVAAVNSIIGLAYTYDMTGTTGWTSVASSPFTGIGTSVVYNGIYFVATGLGTTNRIAYSTTGITWTGSSTITNYGDICWNGKRFVALGNNSMSYSPDGITWYTNTTNIFTYGNGIASNSQIGTFIAPSAIVLNNNGINGNGMSASQTLEIVSSDPYYQTGFNNVTIKIETNNIY